MESKDLQRRATMPCCLIVPGFVHLHEKGDCYALPGLIVKDPIPEPLYSKYTFNSRDK